MNEKKIQQALQFLFLETNASEYDNERSEVREDYLTIATIMADYATKQTDELELVLKEEFLVNTQLYPSEYHKLFQKKFNRAIKRRKELSNG